MDPRKTATLSPDKRNRPRSSSLGATLLAPKAPLPRISLSKSATLKFSRDATADTIPRVTSDEESPRIDMSGLSAPGK